MLKEIKIKRTMQMYAHRTHLYEQIDSQMHVTTLDIYVLYIHGHNNLKHFISFEWFFQSIVHVLFKNLFISLLHH